MPRHVDELTVHRFRGLRDVSLTDLRGVNLFVGTNDSGKTSLLEALSIFVQPLAIGAWFDAAWRREIRLPWSLALDWFFPHFASQGNFQDGAVDISGQCPSINLRRYRATLEKTTRLKAAPSPTSEYRENGAVIELAAVLESGDEKREKFTIWDDEPLEQLELSWPKRMRGLNVRTLHGFRAVEQLSEATLKGQKSSITDLLTKVDPEIQDIDIPMPNGKSPSIYLKHRLAGRAPLSEFGDGVRRALAIAVALTGAVGGILLIDEIEASIHVSALGPLFKWLVEGCAEFNVQLFATTHSLEAVDAILESNGDESDLAAFRLRQESSGIVCQRLSGDLLHRLRYERGLDVRV
jgi:hypothetical protein